MVPPPPPPPAGLSVFAAVRQAAGGRYRAREVDAPTLSREGSPIGPEWSNIEVGASLTLPV